MHTRKLGRSGLALAIAGLILAATPSLAQKSEGRQSLNLGIVQYAGGDFTTAKQTFAGEKGALARLWQARSQLQLQDYEGALDQAGQARSAGLSPEDEETAKRVQIAAIRLGGLQRKYASLSRELGIAGADKDYNITLTAGTDFVTGLLREFDNNNNAVRKNDVRFTFAGSGSYRLPWRPGGFQPVVGYNLSHRHFAENQDFNQQNHQPFASLSGRISDRATVSFGLNHTTSLSGSGLDLFVQQYGVTANGVWQVAGDNILRAGWGATYSNFNNVQDDDNLTNSVFVALTLPDGSNPANRTTMGTRVAVVSAEADSSSHAIGSLFAGRDMLIGDKYRLSGQALYAFATFNNQDPVEAEQRRDHTFAVTVSVERDLTAGFVIAGNAGLTRVLSNIARVDRTSAVVGAQIKKRF